MSWLHSYNVKISNYTLIRGRTHFDIELVPNARDMPQNEQFPRNAITSACRSCTDFCIIRKLLLQHTKPCVACTKPYCQAKSKLGRVRSYRRSSICLGKKSEDLGQTRESNSVEYDSPDKRHSAISFVSLYFNNAMLPSKRKQCKNRPCPCSNLHVILRLSPISLPLMLLGRLSLVNLQRQLQRLISLIQNYFRSLPRHLLQCLDLSDQCQTLSAFSAFIGFDKRVRSIAIAKSPITLNSWKSNLRSGLPFPTCRDSHTCSEGDDQSSVVLEGIEIEDSMLAMPILSLESPISNGGDAGWEDECFIVENEPEFPYQEEDEVCNRLDSVPEKIEEQACEDIDLMYTHAESVRESMYLPNLNIRPTIFEKRSPAYEHFCDHIWNQFGREVLQEEIRGQTSFLHLSIVRRWELALYTACHVGHSYAVESILLHGVNPNAALRVNSYTALHAVARYNHADIVDILMIHEDLMLDPLDATGMTPLLLAIENGHIEVAKKLIQVGANVHHVSSERKSAVYLAVMNSSIPILQIILPHHPQLDIPPRDSNITALKLAVAHGNLRICAMLLAHGADPSQYNDEGEDITAVALELGHTKIADLCRSYQMRAQDQYVRRSIAPHTFSVDAL